MIETPLRTGVPLIFDNEASWVEKKMVVHRMEVWSNVCNLTPLTRPILRTLSEKIFPIPVRVAQRRAGKSPLPSCCRKIQLVRDHKAQPAWTAIGNPNTREMCVLTTLALSGAPQTLRMLYNFQLNPRTGLLLGPKFFLYSGSLACYKQEIKEINYCSKIPLIPPR